VKKNNSIHPWQTSLNTDPIYHVIFAPAH